MKYFVLVLTLVLAFCGLSCGGGGNEASLQETQSINLSSVGNARELGGYPTIDGMHVKRGVLLRTAALNGISSSDLARLTDVYHLAVITDFRMSLEAAPKPDPEIEGVKYLNLRVINEELFTRDFAQKLQTESDPIKRMKLIVDSGFVDFNMYVNFLSDETGKKAYREFFRELLDLPEGRSLLFHCTQGKDRTGCGAMLILSALGVSEDVILKDYMLTNDFNAEKIAGQHKMLADNGVSEEDAERYMIILDEVNPKLMTILFSWLKENYVSPVGYIIDELGLSEDEIESLKAKFLE